ncbi:hypothetical protein PAPYR_11797 [Paratrimastix pyriformis]|uniref:Uncharacterized protein n=1 Tax=Paratrimastix pyriformis TaxID=342808 RepID=A0ABQ8U346_9EUKA|nr:hypothetical protein PAPYR_11797 [Paratrimastix pyriformis]
MVCQLGVVAALGGGCPQVGVVCLADVLLSPGWTECFASEVGPVWCSEITTDIWPCDACLTVWSDGRSFSGMLLMRHVLWERKLLGMLPLNSVKAGQGQPVIQFQYWTQQMGAPMPASAQNLRMNGQLWTTSEGLVVTLGPVKGSTVKPGPLTPAAVPAGAGEGGRWATQTSPSGTRKTRWGQPQEGGKPAVGDNLKGHRWATPAGWGWTRWRKPRRGQPQEGGKPAVGDNLKGHRWATSAGWGRTRRRKTQGGQPQEGGNPPKGQPHEGRAEENPDFGENLDGGMEDDAGDGNAAQVAGAGFLLLTTPLSFGSALGTGRFGKGDWLGYHGCK